MTEMEPVDRPTTATPRVLFSEGGASWLWVLAGPVVGVIMVLLQVGAGSAIGLTIPVAFSAMVSAFLAIQVKAARIHTSVELTADTLRSGTETVDIEDIVSIYPEPTTPAAPERRDWRAGSSAPSTHGLHWDSAGQSYRDRDVVEDTDPDTGRKAGDWQTSRSLGELTGVPRGRTAIGLRLTGGRDVRAWARRHRKLRAALTQLVEGRERGSGL